MIAGTLVLLLLLLLFLFSEDSPTPAAVVSVPELFEVPRYHQLLLLPLLKTLPPHMKSRYCSSQGQDREAA